MSCPTGQTPDKERTQVPTSRFWIILGALNAALAVAMAAASAHAPALQAAAYLPNAVAMHQFHALGLLAVGLLLRDGRANRWWTLAGCAFTLGLLMFCFNLYARALWDFDALRALVPTGGTCFMGGWLLLALGSWRQRA